MAGEGNNRTILVVEDEKLLLDAILRKLTKLGFQVEGSTSAEGALNYLKSGEVPDAIWLDYYLGDMNGFEFMSKLKEDDKWQKIPVFVVSNSASEKKKTNMLALGIKKYLLKAEYKLEDIAKIITEFLDGNENYVKQ